MRIMSRESAGRVYHRPECRYARRISEKNQMRMKWEDAEWRGYRPCRCCDGMRFLYKIEKDKIERYTEHFPMDVDLIVNTLYVRTDAGCWKIIYKIRDQRFILLHRNYANGRISLEEADKAPFHRQRDMAESGSIMKYIKYIRAHDAFRQKNISDYRQMPRDSKKQERYYQAAKRRAQKRGAQKMDQLFRMIESREGIQSLSFC